MEQLVQSENKPDPSEVKSLRLMRWLVLIVACVGFLGTLAVCVLLKSPYPMAGVLVLRPIISFLFPKKPPP